MKYRYLTIQADFNWSGIGDDYKGQLKQSDLEVNDYLWQKLTNWVKKYTPIISMSMVERESKISNIKELDDEGIKIAEEFKKVLGPEIEVKYYSEGL